MYKRTLLHTLPTHTHAITYYPPTHTHPHTGLPPHTDPSRARVCRQDGGRSSHRHSNAGGGAQQPHPGVRVRDHLCPHLSGQEHGGYKEDSASLSGEWVRTGQLYARDSLVVV